MFVERQNPANLLDRLVDQECNAFHGRLTPIGRFKMAHGAQNDIDFLDDMHRQTDCPGLVHDAALDTLANPPGGVGRETKTTLGIEFLQRMNQAEIALFDQIEQRNAAIQVVLGNIDHQAEIVLDHFLARRKITGPHAPRRLHLICRCQQRLGANLVQVKLGDIFKQVNFRGCNFWLREQNGFFRWPVEVVFLFPLNGLAHFFGKY